MPDLRCNPGVLAATLASLALAGCPKPPRAPQPDAGPPVDAVVIDYTDTDGDGLCDRTELSRGTDPELADTDGDGLTDRVEVDFGFQPTRTDSPERELLVSIDEAPRSTVRVPVAYVVRGEGESYAGAFQQLPVAGEVDASHLYQGSFAFGADPRDNVFEIIPEEERINGVFGRTELLFEVLFEAPATLEQRGCIRGYPWRYNIKRDDGTLVLARRYLLVVAPDGATEWCAPAGLCI